MGELVMKRSRGRGILDFFFPPRCAVCDGLLRPESRGICPDCEKRLSPVEEPRCFGCGKTVEYEETEYCRDCRKHRHIFLRGFPLYRYVPPVSDAMAAMKYHGRAEYAEFYGRSLSEAFGETWKAYGIEGLVPVPVHRRRLRKRGYNQAELLARAVARETGLPVFPDALCRGISTTAQKKLSREERASNLREAFQPGSQSPPARVLLVDDIFTTGATADACAEVLLRMGAEEVYLTTVCC